MTSRFTKTAVIGALAALGALAWSGCGSGSDERYYCDNGGCYSCDAYGCSGVKAPSKPSCSSNNQCASGVCTTKGCTTQCSSDAQCAKGETCQQGLCFEPGGGGTIVDNDGGPTPDPDGGPGPGCGECAAPNTCVAGKCTAPTTCKFSSECAGGKICADGACLTPCNDGKCEAGYTCTKDVCQPTANPGDGGAPVSCTTDDTCGEDKYCSGGKCVEDTRPKPNCTGDEQCGGTSAARKCLAGYCRYTCEGSGANADKYCRTIDARIGICAADGVCRSTKEVSPQCTGPGTCPLSGQSCIDNQCK